MLALATGIGLGLLGSLHCVGMCGPLAMALPYGTQSPPRRVLLALLYSTGRVATYVVIGLLLASLGEVAAMAGLQRIVSIVLGGLLITFIFVPRYYRAFTDKLERTAFYTSIKSGIRQQFQDRSKTSFFVTGMLNGLLPCTMVYLAAFAAINTGNWQTGALLMVGFGLGTSPALITLAAAPSLVALKKINWHRVVPVIALLAGSLMIVRGVATDLPDVPALGMLNPKDLTICR
ncbi:MAG: sulfite exporter TauE/SafE family protein [Bacteroidota bacterium]